MMTSGLQHSIRTVSQRTGLSQHVIRVWEKRYGTIRPGRSGGNQRVYSESDINRLQCLQKLTSQGFSISKLAHLDDATLGQMVVTELDNTSTSSSPMTGHKPTDATVNAVSEALDAVQSMNLGALEDCLERALLNFGQIGMLERVVAPLAEAIGEEWRGGRLQVAHEHLATTTLRTFLGRFVRPYTIHPSAPVMVATTPAGQLHELGAILVAATASGMGWRVTYAGASLPCEEIARIASGQNARVVALSLIHPEDDPLIPLELKQLRRILRPTTRIIMGGRAAGAYAQEVSDEGILMIRTLDDLRSVLDSLRAQHHGDLGKSARIDG